MTLLVDTAAKTVQYVTTTRKHDRQIVPQAVKRNAVSFPVLTSDAGNDDQKRRVAHPYRRHSAPSGLSTPPAASISTVLSTSTNVLWLLLLVLSFLDLHLRRLVGLKRDTPVSAGDDRTEAPTWDETVSEFGGCRPVTTEISDYIKCQN